MKTLLKSIALSLLFAACQNSEKKAKEDTEQIETRQEQQNPSGNDLKQNRMASINARFDSINTYIENNPGDANALAERASWYLKRKNASLAQADVQRALTLDSNVAKAHDVLAKLAYAQQDSKTAKEEWQRCANLDKQNVNCRISLAQLYVAVNDYDNSIKLLDEVIAIDNQNATAYLMKGLALRDFKGDTALALNYFQKTIDLDQNNTEALDMMAVTLGYQKDTLAELYYKRLLALEPNNADVYFKMGVMYMGTNQVNRALEAYAKALQLDPGDARSHYNMGYMHVELKLYKEAINFFSNAIKYKNRNYEAYYGRGFAYEMLGDVNNARADYKKSLEILNIYKPAQEALARLKRYDDQMQNAVKNQ